MSVILETKQLCKFYGAGESATVYEDGRVMVTMHMKSATELRFESLEQTQAEQDEVLAELLGGEA